MYGRLQIQIFLTKLNLGNFNILQIWVMFGYLGNFNRLQIILTKFKLGNFKQSLIWEYKVLSNHSRPREKTNRGDLPLPASCLVTLPWWSPSINQVSPA